MRSQIVVGSVYHWRKLPKQHSFSYPVVTLALDLDELQGMTLAPALFAYNQRAILSVNSGDYLGSSGTLREKLERVLFQHGIAEAPSRITIFTAPRYFGYVFNPVTFFACFDRHEKLVGLITQVNNTFGESHVYPLVCQPNDLPFTWRFGKDFFVSPFFSVDGDYEVIFESEGSSPSIGVNLSRDGEVIFKASLKGVGIPFSRSNLLKTLIKFPINLLLTMPRIHWQALILFFKTGVSVYRRPQPSSVYTIKSKQNIIHKARLGLLTLMGRYRTR